MKILMDELVKTRQIVDQQFDTLLEQVGGPENRVIQAMRYSAIGAGKALRPFLVLTTASLLKIPQEYAIRVACALEMVHTYSLIHDDLPAMDNDTLRRGKPTCHIQFDEATAILAGDALLTKAFEILSDEKTHPDAVVRCRLVQNLATAAGAHGMIGGQMIDLIGEHCTLSLSEIERMQSMKTGALLTYACTACALMQTDSSSKAENLTAFAQAIGIMFQITDDILDIEGDDNVVGKTLGKDKNAQKSTFVSLLGIEQARKMAHDLGEKALQSLSDFNDDADLLRQTVHFILTRNK